MLYKRLFSFLMMAIVTVAAASVTFAVTPKDKDSKAQRRVLTPINLAILIQDDLVSQVGNELDETRGFSAPTGWFTVMVGYITTGTLQGRQPFTTDLTKPRDHYAW